MVLVRVIILVLYNCRFSLGTLAQDHTPPPPPHTYEDDSDDAEDNDDDVHLACSHSECDCW